MAQEVIIRLRDDLDSSDAAETMVFAFDGKGYEIDLSEKNAAAFRKAVGKYIEVARRTQRPLTVGAGKTGTTRARSRELAAIREWAEAAGYFVPKKGRIPQDVQEAYAKAHQ